MAGGGTEDPPSGRHGHRSIIKLHGVPVERGTGEGALCKRKACLCHEVDAPDEVQAKGHFFVSPCRGPVVLQRGILHPGWCHGLHPSITPKNHFQAPLPEDTKARSCGIKVMDVDRRTSLAINGCGPQHLKMFHRVDHVAPATALHMTEE